MHFIHFVRGTAGRYVCISNCFLGMLGIDRLASLARVVASSALESLGIRRKEPKMKAMRKEPRAMKV